MATDSGIQTADAIHAKCDVVLNAHELDAVSGGMLWLPLLAYYKVLLPGRNEGTTSPGGQNPQAQLFQQILQQMTQGG